MQFATLALALTAAAVSAAPAPKQDEFHVLFSVSGDNAKPNYVSANLASLDGAKPGHFALKGERLSVFPGNPAFLSGGTVNKDLAFDLTTVFGSGKATTIVPKIGSTPGVFQPLDVVENDGVHDLKWSVAADGQLQYLTAEANNQFFSCDVQIGNEKLPVLSLGNPTADGKAPKGCKFTKLVKE